MELVGRADPALDTSLTDVLEGADVLVDFTTPDAAPANVFDAIDAGVHVVVGSTGFDLDQLRRRSTGSAARRTASWRPTSRSGRCLMMQASKLIAPHMPEVEIIELHHDRKVDAPSGTAKRTAS